MSGGDAAGAASCGRVACAVCPWGRAESGLQGGRVLVHAEQRGALRLAEEAPRGCHSPSGYGAGGGGQGRRLSWERIPEATRLRAGSVLGEKGERPPAAPSDAYCQECAGGSGSGHRGASTPAASVSPAQSCFCGRPEITLCQLSEHATPYPHCFGLARLLGRRQHRLPLTFLST